MTAKTLSIAVPWNNASYIPCNGFHPLYRALFENEGVERIVLNVLDEPAWAQELKEKPRLKEVLADLDNFRFTLKGRWSESEVAREFLDWNSAEDLWITSRIPGHVEVHHTSPLTSGMRPFVLHCESFLPIFMPFAYQGRGFVGPIESVRTFYRELFEAKSCLAIYSHLPETLDEIGRFFNSHIINEKLVLTRTGLSAKSCLALEGARRPEPAGEPCFLFTSSAHQQPVAFKLRGGYAVLMFLEKYFREGRKGLFVFRCKRPQNVELAANGINLESLIAAEEDQRIVWVTGYLPEKEQMALFRRADFFLLPSANLHSVSIMQAQAAGAIPVVSDTVGISRFVLEGRTGITVSGVRETIWRTDPGCGVLTDDHTRWSIELSESLALQMYGSIAELLDHANQYCEMQKNIIDWAKTHYVGSVFRDELFLDIAKRLESTGSGIEVLESNSARLPLLERVTREAENLFESPPSVYGVLASGVCQVYWLKGVYWLYPWKSGVPGIRGWSPLTLAAEGALGAGGVEVARCLEDLKGRLLAPYELAVMMAISAVVGRLKRVIFVYPRIRHLLVPIVPFVRRGLGRLERIAFDQKNRSTRMRAYLESVPVVGPVLRLTLRSVRSIERIVPGMNRVTRGVSQGIGLLIIGALLAGFIIRRMLQVILRLR